MVTTKNGLKVDLRLSKVRSQSLVIEEEQKEEDEEKSWQERKRKREREKNLAKAIKKRKKLLKSREFTGKRRERKKEILYSSTLYTYTHTYTVIDGI